MFSKLPIFYREVMRNKAEQSGAVSSSVSSGGGGAICCCVVAFVFSLRATPPTVCFHIIGNLENMHD